MVICIAFVIVLTTVIIPQNKYNTAMKPYNEGKYDEVMSIPNDINGYKDSSEKLTAIISKLTSISARYFDNISAG